MAKHLKIIMLLVMQFNSIRKPLIILSAIPLDIISLAGIVINNAIIFLERLKIEIEDNARPKQEAIIEACQRRMRPILLTTATTVFGLIPLYLRGGGMWEPMAGLMFSTLLTLGFIPVLYALLYNVRYDNFE